MQVIAQLEDPTADLTPMYMYNKFIERVRRNLHLVLAFSPIGDAFRNRLRMFPSLINCCTIDWFKVRVHCGNRLRMFPSLINCCTIDWFKVRA